MKRVNFILFSRYYRTKKAEEALSDSEERFRTLADNIPNFAWMAYANGGIFWFNKQWYEYTGTTLEEVQGWGWQKVHHPDNIKAVKEKWTAKIKKENHTVTYHILEVKMETTVGS